MIDEKKGQTNRALGEARAAKNDEFYTRREFIEAELQHYFPHFRGKVVYCNCDDPKISEFYKYFKGQFHFLGLRRLITTCYKNQDSELFSKHDKESAVSVEYDGIKENIRFLRGDGDFRSPESIELLQKADIICTNPPFSLFREYVVQLVAEKKRFLIIGNFGAVSYKDIFRLFKEEKLWLGMSPRSMNFDTPNDGEKCVNAVWYTNLPHKKRTEPLILTERYSESAYPKYENYDAIEVAKVAKIPRDYAGLMGVPITFLEKWNPKQFEILGVPENLDIYGLKTQTYTTQEKKDAYFAKFGKPGTYDLDAAGVLMESGILHKKYGRVFIRNKNPK